jgi:hypothetical protein
VKGKGRELTNGPKLCFSTIENLIKKKVHLFMFFYGVFFLKYIYILCHIKIRVFLCILYF